MKTICCNAVFHVADLQRSLKFYQEILGFNVDFKWGEPNFYAGLSLGEVSLHIGSKYRFKNNTGHGHIYITCDEVDSYYKDLSDKGVEIMGPIGDQDYGLRDFVISDPDGNSIGFGAEITKDS